MKKQDLIPKILETQTALPADFDFATLKGEPKKSVPDPEPDADEPLEKTRRKRFVARKVESADEADELSEADAEAGEMETNLFTDV